jgi:hypothetical protein
VDRRTPPGTTLTDTPDGGLRADTTRGAGSVYVQWKLADGVIPTSPRVVNVETLVCGTARGDFFEVYGPYGAAEIEYEVTQPSADGCWHFTRDPGTDYSVEIYVNGDASLTVSRIEYRVTFGP